MSCAKIITKTHIKRVVLSKTGFRMASTNAQIQMARYPTISNVHSSIQPAMNSNIAHLRCSDAYQLAKDAPLMTESATTFEDTPESRGGQAGLRGAAPASSCDINFPGHCIAPCAGYSSARSAARRSCEVRSCEVRSCKVR